jgi:hypothetical protein
MILKTLVLLLGLLDTSFVISQNIADLDTDEKTLVFVRKLNNYYYQKAFINPPKKVFGLRDYKARIKKFGAFSYEKADFDSNGVTDLLFNGYYDDYEGNKDCRRISFVVLSYGNNSFKVKELTHGPFIEFFTAKKITINGHDCIVTLKTEGEFKAPKSYILRDKVDTLNCIDEEFIERVSPNTDTINQIEFCVFGGLGSFATLRLSITDTNTIMESEPTLRERKSAIDSGGVFQTKIESAVYSKITGLLKHIDFSHLDDQYRVKWSDDLFGSLKITYNGNKVKTIRDYGLIGTYGLAALQNQLIELRNSQHWSRLSK